MRKVFVFIIFALICSTAYADDISIQKVEITPLSGGVSFNSITFAARSVTGWVTAPSVEMRGRKELSILNTSTTDNIYLTGVSGSTATGVVYPRETVTFKAASNLHVFVSANSVVTVECWEIR